MLELANPSTEGEHVVKTTIAALAGLLLLSGCNPAYKQPDSGSIALLRLYAPQTTAKFSNVSVYIHDDDKCTRAQKLRVLGGVNLGGVSASEIDRGMPKDKSYAENSYVEVEIDAAKRTNFSLVGAHGTSRCNLTMSFQPKPGRQYEVIYGLADPFCGASVDEIALQSGSLMRVKEPTAQTNQKLCTFFWN